jgi:aerobic-type carbon monoxide dehydrogenase small subunit (CoxS/CutS family)
MARFELIVNGAARSVDADGATPLLWVLRDELDLTGAKYGCGEGLCGACTVLEQGVAVRSCQVSLAAAAGKRYTTIEGLAADGAHPVQRAWLEENVSQCGYCQPGMILEIVALVARRPRPTEAEIAAALGDHLCRCGSYPRITRALRRLAGESRGVAA